MKTQAAVLFEVNSPLEIVELDIPSLKKGQVLVEVHYSGICQTQLNEIKGLKGKDKFLPHTLGHEGSGKVVEVGNGVKKIKTGDFVVMSWIKGQGHDVPSTVYKYNNITVNSGAISTFMTYAVVSENRLVKIPKMSMKTASLLGCAIPTGSGIIFNEMKFVEKKSVSIWGMGGIGLSALLAAKIKKCKPIIVIDVKQPKLLFAKTLGADHAILAQDDPLTKIRGITNNQGCDFSIECVGRTEVMQQAFDSVKPSGGHLVVAGNPKKGDRFSIDPFALISGKKLTGTWGGSTNIDKDIPSYVKLFIEGKFKINRLISHTFSLNSVNESMEVLAQGKCNRAVLKLKD